VAESSPPGQPEAAAERAEVFRRIEEGIAALRRGVRGAIQMERRPPAQGSLRFRPQAAREVHRRHLGEEEEEAQAPRSPPGPIEPKSS
jgi:hypothetical protein